MAEIRARVFNGLKFMWDGESYESLDAAKAKQAEYEKDNFETRVVEEGGKVELYTRRVVTDVEVEGAAPM